MRTYSVDEVGQYLARGFWVGRSGLGPWDHGGEILVNLSGLSRENKFLANWAMDAWELLGFDFTPTGSERRAELVLSNDDSGAYTWWSFSHYSGQAAKTHVNVGTELVAGLGAGFGSYTSQVWLHELGHALGLGHAGPYNGEASYGVDNRYSNDSWQMSAMSYFSQSENSSVNASYAHVLTPMPGDIAAVERLYDFERNASAGDTVYFWGSNASGTYGRIGQGIKNGSLNGPFAMTIIDDGGRDMLNFSGERQAVKLDLSPGSINSAFGLTGNLLIERKSVIEGAIGSSGDDRIWGQAADNHLEGRLGNDRLDGRLGNDLLLGGPGADTLIGGGGNDFLRGGEGADLIDGGPGFDILRFSDAAVRLDLQSGIGRYGEAEGDAIRNIERVETGTGNDTLLGDNDRSVLVSSGGDDQLYGRGGDDLLNSGSGQDRLHGGAGNDSLFGGAGPDVMDGGAGTDMVLYAGTAAIIDLFYTALNSGAAWGDQMISIENVSAGNGDDDIRGNGGANRLIGNGGHDLIQGRNGNDVLEGRDGNDTLIGGAGDDMIFGGTGNDRIICEAGRDLVAGGLGSDEFVFRGGQMKVVDFLDNVDELVIGVSALGLSGLTVDQLLDTAVVSGGGLLLQFGEGIELRLQGIRSADLLIDDLTLV